MFRKKDDLNFTKHPLNSSPDVNTYDVIWTHKEASWDTGLSSVKEPKVQKMDRVSGCTSKARKW